MQQTVYIVDDDHQVRAATSLLLQVLGYRTETYASGREFLAGAPLESGCILLDVRMPGPSGLQVQEELRRRGAALPVIVVSGHGDMDTMIQAMRLGAVEFLEKPHLDRALLDAVQRALGSATGVEQREAAKTQAEIRLASLSEPERLVLRGLVAGFTIRSIARRLELSAHTVAMHRAAMMTALDVHSLSGAIRLAIDGNLTPLEEDEDEAAAA